MAADPKLDEAMIARMLTNEFLLSPQGVRSLLSMVLLACYDRKVEREFMADMIGRADDVHILLSQMESGSKMRAMLTALQPETKTDAIDDELKKLGMEWQRKREGLAAKFSEVRQCPTTRDTIN
jgi:hypothetical protein